MKDTRISVKLSEHMRPILETQADLEHRTIKEVVTRSIEEYLDKYKRPVLSNNVDKYMSMLGVLSNKLDEDALFDLFDFLRDGNKAALYELLSKKGI